ncbi:MAG: DNA-formamidopyrimidine glycosylase [Omnitrophica WOR_2 bacterium RIFCSPHIGHO2_02_FULL_52_10]|nr:MAG: DNA-formamidopyrimidine glycosylase [Omnitrophica WOR_2 bacterium RIFCSPHIGHO2_02_FULL_52_10]
MPELPEVQTTVDDLLNLGIIGRAVKRVTVAWPAVTGSISGQNLTSLLRTKKFAHIRRRGKYILFQFDNGRQSLLHLRMSGRLKFVPLHTPVDKHEHLRILLDNDMELRLHDPRKFGRFTADETVKAKLARLGIDPLSKAFTRRALAELLLNRRRQLKPLLLDQSVIAGLGNICADESLWLAGLHPQRLSASLKGEEINGLRSGILRFLKSSIARGGTSLGNGEQNFVSVSSKAGGNQTRLNVYGRAGRPCRRCRQLIQRIVVAQRGTYYCPRCQRKR